MKNNILVTGGTGMVGFSLRKFLPDAIYCSRKDCDLLDKNQVDEYFERVSPDVIIHLAARVGGVIDNNSSPYQFFYDNIVINTNVIDASIKNNVKYLVCMSSVCVYSPKISEFPIEERLSQFDSPDCSVYGYGYAKRMMTVQLECAKRQYGTKYCIIYASNMFGPHDCFDKQKSHVVASLINKFHMAKEHKEVELYGTGKPMRQLTYVDDAAKLLVYCVDNKLCGEYNFANPISLSIKKIAEIICKVIGFNGQIKFNGQVDGNMRRDVSIKKISNLYDEPFTNFEEGIKQTYIWYINKE